MLNMELPLSYSTEMYNFSKKKPTCPWYCSKEYDRFWLLYNSYMYYAHKDALTRCKEVADNTAATLYSMVKGPWPGRVPASIYRGRRSRKSSRKWKNRKEIKKKIDQDLFVLTDDDTLQVHLAETERIGRPDRQNEGDIDEDYLTFMEQSVKHRIKWNYIKEMKNLQIETSANDISHAHENDDVLSGEFQEHPDDVRNREMQKMYGPLSGQIHAMETAMQLSFDRLSTLHEPSLWPNIPLKLSFD